ncbi:MAG: helix-turn-helix domain-containing protein [Clostridia bacterium]|nr:helix-turn-helix domain-containing protein [Clostridia bacterium]
MKQTYSDKIALHSTLLGKLLQNLDEQSLGSVSNIFQASNVQEFFKDEEILSTVECFFKNNLNVSKTSKDASLHRNTLIYRLEKIERTLGLDIRNFEDALTLKILIVLKKLEQKRKRRTHKLERLQSRVI